MNTNPRNTPLAAKCPQCGGDLAQDAEEYSLCRNCGTSLIWRRGAAPGGEKALRGMKLRVLTCVEDEVTHLELFRMLAPAGWQLQGGWRWLPDNPGMPAQVAFQILNPGGQEAFEVLPNMNFTWTNNLFSGMLNRAGSRYFGSEVHQPLGLRDAFQKFVLPRYRPDVTGLRVIHFEPQPELAYLVKAEAPITGDGTAEGGKIRIGYTRQDLQYEEDICGVVEVFRTLNPGMFGKTESDLWFIDHLFAFRAGAGRLDAAAPLFTAMLYSFKLNPQWYAAHKSISQHMVRNQVRPVRSAAEIAQVYARVGPEMREQNLAEWYDRQQVYDQISADSGHTTREVEGFYDPHRQETVELPLGYGYAWANAPGEYILVETADFDPNQTPGQGWERMPPA